MPIKFNNKLFGAYYVGPVIKFGFGLLLFGLLDVSKFLLNSSI